MVQVNLNKEIKINANSLQHKEMEHTYVANVKLNILKMENVQVAVQMEHF